jgi:hypothetical protein
MSKKVTSKLYNYFLNYIYFYIFEKGIYLIVSKMNLIVNEAQGILGVN